MTNFLINSDGIRVFISEKKDGSMKLLGDFENEKIIKNRKKFFRKIGINFEDIVLADLVHGVNVKIVDIKDKGRIIKKTDGLITKEKDIFLIVTVADCLPIFLYTKNGKGVGILHGGWRGIVGGIVENGIAKLLDLTKCLPEEIFLKVGPSIGPCCFEVGEKAIECFEKYQGVIEIREGKKYVDLRKVVKQIALQEGLLKDKVDINCECTSCLSKKYFSFRRDKPEKVQAMIAGIGFVNLKQ